MPSITPKTQPQKKRTYIYVDGFNLYYGALVKFNKNKPVLGLKWLDIDLLCQNYLKHHDIQKIKYFTANVSGKHDTAKPARQQTYIRALKTIPKIEVIYGKYSYPTKTIRLSDEVSIKAQIPEEKRSDVSLCVHLVNDAHLKRFDTAIVISNDSDFIEAVKIVRDEIKLAVGLMNPFNDFQRDLMHHATQTELYTIRENVVRSCQFPPTMKDSSGNFQKPTTW